MKKIMLILMMLCLVTVTYAADKNITIYSFVAYSDSAIISSDWEDTLLSTSSGKTVEIQTRFENEGNETFEVYMKGILSLSTDLSRDKTVTIAPDEKKVVVLSYFIPVDTRDGTYPLDVYYEYYTNGTKQKTSNNFDLRVAKVAVTEEDLCKNLTQQLVAAQIDNNKVNQVLMNYTKVSDSLAQCNLDVGALRANVSLLQEFKNKYDNESPQYLSTSRLLSQCQADKSTLHTDSEIESAKFTAKAEQQNSDNMLLFGIVIIGGIYFYFKNRSKKVGDEAGRDSTRKGEATFSSASPWRRR